MNDVFISYSRKDSDFVRQLHDALSKEDKGVWIDWEGIPPTAEWLSEIYSAIEDANTIIFVLTPDSVASEICSMEVLHAVKHNKRLVPVVRREVDARDVPEELAKLNWIFFRENDVFDSSFRMLIEALETDLDWVYVHTRLLTRAIEWDGKNRDKSFLLRGADLKAAEEWHSQSSKKEPAPTHLQTQYIQASKKRQTRRRRVTLGSVTLVVIVSILILIGLYDSRKIALSRQLSNQARTIAENPNDTNGFFDRALLLAVQAGKVKDTYEARDALFRVLQSQPESKPFIRNLLWSFKGKASDVAFSPNGESLASASWDGDIRLWNRIDNREETVFRRTSGKRVYAVAYSPDSSLIASGHEQGQLRLWNMTTMKLESDPLVGHTGAVTAVAFSGDGKKLASAGSDRTIRLWDVAAKEPLGGPLLGHEGPVQDVVFSQNGKRLASLGNDGTVWLWDLETHPPSGKPFFAGAAHVMGVAFSKESRHLLSVSAENGKRKVRLWDTVTEEPVEDSVLHGLLLDRMAGKLTQLRPDGKKLASVASRGDFRKWDVVQFLDVMTNRSLGNFRVPGMEVKVHAVSFSPKGNHLAIGAESLGSVGKVWLLDVASREPLTRQLTGHDGGASAGVFSVAFSPDSRILASSGFDGTIRLWDPVTGKPAGKPLNANGGYALTVAFSPDGNWIAAGDGSSAVTLWDRNNVSGSGKILGKHDAWVNSVAFSPDGTLLASGSDDTTVRLWNVAAGTASGAPLKGHKATIHALVFSPDGKKIASAGRTVRLWNVATGESIGIPLNARRGAVQDVAFSPDGKWLAMAIENSGEKKGEVWLWDIVKEHLLDTPLEGHEYSTQAVAFSPDSRQLASAGGDNTVRLWDVETWKPLGEPLRSGRIFKDLTFSPDGKWMAGANDDATVWLWDMDWKTRACRIANRDLTYVEWKQYLDEEDPDQKVCESIPSGQNTRAASRW